MRLNRALLIFVILMAASLAVLLLLPPISQDQSYHRFADQRTFLHVLNFWNVASNLPFIAVGSVGLQQFHRNSIAFVIFLGIFLTGFGSSYYHWDPNDRTLFWDRLPMTLCFIGVLTTVVEERVSAKARTLLWPLVAMGIVSLLLWRWTGDLRLYGWVQFFPCLALPILILMLPPKYSGTFYWLAAVALYALAKLFEFYDRAVHAHFILSGHTLKHLLGACRLLRGPAVLPDASTDHLIESLNRGDWLIPLRSSACRPILSVISDIAAQRPSAKRRPEQVQQGA
jgi:hypothetical protein